METIITFDHTVDDIRDTILINGAPARKLSVSRAEAEEFGENIIKKWHTLEKPTFMDLVDIVAEAYVAPQWGYALIGVGFKFTRNSQFYRDQIMEAFVIKMSQLNDEGSLVAYSKVIEGVIDGFLDGEDEKHIDVMSLLLFGALLHAYHTFHNN